MGAPFHYVTLSTFCYATETLELVRQALSFVATGNPHTEISMEQNIADGHFGDQIIVLTTRLDVAPAISDFCFRVIAPIELEEFVKRIDNNCSFHLRFSKEETLQGQLKLSDTDSVIMARGKIRAYPAHRENAISTIQEILASYHNG